MLSNWNTQVYYCSQNHLPWLRKVVYYPRMSAQGLFLAYLLLKIGKPKISLKREDTMWCSFSLFITIKQGLIGFGPKINYVFDCPKINWIWPKNSLFFWEIQLFFGKFPKIHPKIHF